MSKYFPPALMAKLPKYYVSELLTIINKDLKKNESFNASQVRNVISGQINNLHKIATVLGAIEVLIKQTKEQEVEKEKLLEKVKELAA